MMGCLLFALVILLALGAPSDTDAAYCLCNSGLSDSVLQKNIDYACGNGADCSAILQNGGCYNPNTVKDHCNYAVNSYYQRKSQIGASCDFQGTATISQTAPTTITTAACVYQATPSTGGGGTTTPTTGSGTTIPGGTLGPTGSNSFGPTDNGASVTLSSVAMLLMSFSISLVTPTFI